MKKILNTSKIQEVVDSKGDLYLETGTGHRKIKYTEIYRMTFINVISLVENGKLYYETSSY